MRHLEYIGCKQQLAPWIAEAVLLTTGRESLTDVDFLDACCGTGAVAFYMRTHGARSVHANDVEAYSATVGRAVTASGATPRCLALLGEIAPKSGVQDLVDRMSHVSLDASEDADAPKVGLVEREYSAPRLFFTAANARAIDAVRSNISRLDDLTEDERAFLLASLLVSADAVSNTTSVYGAYLKEFKASALKPLALRPVHEIAEPFARGRATQMDALDPSLYAKKKGEKGEKGEKGRGRKDTTRCRVVYVDPPYNARQYSKNYFPLNAIVWPPERDADFEVISKTKTGIPSECYISPFCRKTGAAEAFRALLRAVAADDHVIISYSSEGIVAKDELLAILGEFGEVTLLEREHKRFASSSCNDKTKKTTLEYLFCVRRILDEKNKNKNKQSNSTAQ